MILKIFALLLFIARFRWPGNISALFFTLIGKVKRKLVTRYEIMRNSQQLPAAPCISLFGQGQCNNKKRKIQIKPFLYSSMQTAIDGNNKSSRIWIVMRAAMALLSLSVCLCVCMLLCVWAYESVLSATSCFSWPADAAIRGQRKCGANSNRLRP